MDDGLKIKQSRPWYREPWTWGLMAGPFIVVVAAIFTAWLAIKDKDDMVVDDYYKKGLEINQEIKRDQAAVDAGISANLMTGEDTESFIRALVKAEKPVVLPTMLYLKLIHPTRERFDETIELKTDGSGFYVGKMSKQIDGRRYVELASPKNDWRLVGEWQVEPRSSLHLGAWKND